MSNARNIADLPNGDDAPIYACRAWVNFNGTTNTAGFCTIRDSGNVSSITDNGGSDGGDYTVNFATAMPDSNYATVGAGSNNSGNSYTGIQIVSQSTTGVNVQTWYAALTQHDALFVPIAVFR